MGYESYIRKHQDECIETAEWRCPKCGNLIEFDGYPDEEYRDVFFERNERLTCYECGITVVARQVYTATKLWLAIEED